MDKEKLVVALVDAMARGTSDLPQDVVEKIDNARNRESGELAKMQLDAIKEDIILAHVKRLPMCQDTGIQVFFIKAGYDFPHLSEVYKTIPSAVSRATQEIPLRPNTVDPFTGKNPGNNLGHNMPAVTVELVEGDGCSIHLLPKGGGSENMSALWMLTPAEGFKGMRKKILEHIQWAGGKPCPPIIIGLGIGGGADIAMKLAKRSLLRPLGTVNSDPNVASMEKEILEAVNKLGVGPMGMGGETTALAVHMEYTSRHPATFPVGMVVQCWCDRRATVDLNIAGEVLEKSEVI